MKQNWEYKKLGEVANATIGMTYKPDNVTNTGTIVLRSGNIQDSKLAFDDIVRIGVSIPENKIVKDGDILMCSRNGSFNLVGKVALISNMTEPMTYGAFMTVIRSKSNPFLFYFFKSHTFREKLTQGKTSTVNQITVNMLKEMEIPVPPLSTQTAIVSELDALSAIIADHKSLLKKYDELEQSIFYDMFGDPVKNDKGWEVKKIYDIYSLKAGKTIKANELSEEPSEGLYPCYGGNGLRGYIAKKSHSGSYPIIGRQGALCGNVNFAEGEFYATEHAVVVSNKIGCIPLFSYFLLTNMKLERLAKGVAQPGLSVASVNEESAIVPPLPLQQEFASKIEAIEAMKADTKKSLAKSEELFNARMDYYFNA